MRTLRLILLSLAALLTLSACNSRSAAIDRMVDELNSPIFRAQEAIDEFRANVAVDDKFREGIEALNAENMTLLLVWQDINGATIRIPILPSAILPAS